MATRPLLVLVTATLAACSLDSDPPAWALGMFRDGTTNEGADAHGAFAADGSVFLAIADPGIAVRFDDMVLQGNHLAYVDPDGRVEQIATVGEQSYARAIRLDDRRRAVVMWGAGNLMLAAYDEQLVRRWQVIPSRTVEPPVDVGGMGEVVYVTRDAVPTERMLHYLDADGQQRWQLTLTTQSGVGNVRLAANGDVFVFVYVGGIRRARYAAADGTLVEDVAISPETFAAVDAVDRDGSSILHLVGGEVVSIDAMGRSGGAARFGTNAPATFASNGDVLVSGFAGKDTVRVMRLAGATGEITGSVNMFADIVGGDDTGIITLGPIGSRSLGLARFDTRN